jgi:glycosyltransferase involved in cell wall biosynthesis
MSSEILHIHKVSGISGSEAHLLSVLPLLRERGWDVRMLVLHEGEPGAREFMERLDVPVEELRIRGNVDPLLLGRLTRRLRGVAAVHTHLVHAHFHGLPAALLARVPVRVAHYHGFTDYPEKRRFVLAERSFAWAATHQVAISHGLVHDLRRRIGLRRPFEVVIYGIRPGAEPPPPPPEPRLLAVGRLVGFKGFDILLKAFAVARRELPGLTLELAGAGPLEHELRPLSSEGVTWLGDVRPIRPVFERNAILVAPSLAEGLGLVALEAHERGRPAIVSGSGGLPELVADGETGIVVPVGDVSALARAMVDLAGDPERVRTLGAAARRRALEVFPEARPAGELGAFYRRAGLAGGR